MVKRRATARRRSFAPPWSPRVGTLPERISKNATIGANTTAVLVVCHASMRRQPRTIATLP